MMLVGSDPKLKLRDYLRDRGVIATAVNRQAARLRELEAQVAALMPALPHLERWEAMPALEDDDLPPDPTPTQRAGQIVGRLAQAMMGQSRPRFWVRAARDALLQWPGVEPDPTLTVTGQGDTLLSGAVAHVAAQALRGPGGEDMSHAAQALARMGAWLQQAEVTE